MKTNSKEILNYTIYLVPNVEFVNPIVFEFNNHLDIESTLFRTYLKTKLQLQNLSETQIHEVVLKRHLQSWEKHFNEIMSIQFPNDFFDFLNSKEKKQQEKILEKETYNYSKMQAIFYRASIDFNYTFSCYRFEKTPKGFEKAKFPQLYHLQDDNTIDIVGETSLTDGQLKSVLKQRNVVIAKFLDNGDTWHCFLHTYDGILGKEVKGSPHIHYISSAFGHYVTKERVLQEIQKFKYKLPRMLHLNYIKKDFDELPE